MGEMASDETPGPDDGPVADPAGPPAAGSRVAGYRLQEQIGQGGMAVVFRAEDERLGRLVALKVLAPALARDESFRQRFVRESRAAAAVDHPHIIPIYEAGEADGALYIAMRYVRGGDVGTLVRRRRAGSPRSSRPWRPRWMPPTRRGWCTGTSSRPTCCWTPSRDGPIMSTSRISG